MSRRFYNRRAINTVARVLPPSQSQEARNREASINNPLHNILSTEETPLSTVLLLVAVSQLTKDRDDMPLPAVLERITPYLDGPQKVQVSSLVNLSRMSKSLHTMKRGEKRGGPAHDPMKSVELIRTLSDVANPHSQPVLKNIGEVYEKSQNMTRSLKKIRSIKTNKGKPEMGDMLDAVSNIIPGKSPLSSMGSMLKAAQMVGNMGGLGNLGNFTNNNNNDTFDDDGDE